MPAAAGLNRLRPVPPNGSFTTTTANADAKTGTQYAVSGDMSSPTVVPVTSAAPSNTLGRWWRMALPNSSQNTADSTESAVSSTGRQP